MKLGIVVGSRIGALLVALALALAFAAFGCASGQPESTHFHPPPDPNTYPVPPPMVFDAGADSGFKLPPEGPASPVPVLTAISPSDAIVGGAGPTVVATGSGFVARSVVEVDGLPVPTSYVSGSELRATLPASALAATAIHKLAVSTGAPGGGRSAEHALTVANPVATLSTLTPNAVVVSAGDTTVKVTGTGFVATSKITFGGADVPTTFTNATTLSATLPAAKLTAGGSVPLVVVNPGPGGGPSPPLSFTVANPTVVLTSVSPSSATVGAGDLTLTATGTGFVAASVVSFNGTALKTTYVSATQLTAAVPSASLAKTGNFSAIVTNPAPGGGVSMPVTFTVGNPTPTIATLTPSTAVLGSAPVVVTIDGTGFVAESQVQFDGAASSTTFVSATEVKATLSATQLARAGAIAVRVQNPAPGGGASGPATFTVTNPTPTLTSVSPATIASRSSDTTINVYGTKFVTGSNVQADGAALDTTFVSATQLRATLPAASLAAATTIAIRVMNPDPGASYSATVTVTVADATTTTCESAGVDVVLDALGATKTATLSYAYGPSPRFAYNPSEPTFYTCPVAQLSTNGSAYAAVVVQNVTSEVVYLDANANCGSTDDAFMAAYQTTSTVPTDDASRQACTGFVANGSLGGGGYASSASNGSSYCPGMTKANGGAIVLLPCEKAVVLVQPYDVTTYGAPGSATFSLE